MVAPTKFFQMLYSSVAFGDTFPAREGYGPYVVDKKRTAVAVLLFLFYATCSSFDGGGVTGFNIASITESETVAAVLSTVSWFRYEITPLKLT